MSTSVAGIAFLALLVLALVAVHVPLGDYMYHVYTSPTGLADREAHLPRHRRQPQSPTALVRLRPQRPGILGGQRAVPVLLPVGAGQAAATPTRSSDTDDPVAGLEHRDQLRNEHQLAGVLGRVNARPSGADGRLGRAELRLRRGGYGRRDGGGARLRPDQEQRAGQLLGGSGPRYAAHPVAALVHRARSC